MKSLILFLFLLVSSIATAHEYFFAFAEMEYNVSTKCLEVTLTASAHDLEDALNENGIAIKELEDHYTDFVMIEKLQNFINEGFYIATNNNSTKFQIIDFKVDETGMVNFYLQSTVLPEVTTITIHFDWLMNTFPKQQNKITYRKGLETSTLVFISNKRTNELKL